MSTNPFDEPYVTLQFPIDEWIRWIPGEMYQKSPFCKAFSKMQNGYDFGASYDINPRTHIVVTVERGETVPETRQRVKHARNCTNALLQRWAKKGYIRLP